MVAPVVEGHLPAEDAHDGAGDGITVLTRKDPVGPREHGGLGAGRAAGEAARLEKIQVVLGVSERQDIPE